MVKSTIGGKKYNTHNTLKICLFQWFFFHSDFYIESEVSLSCAINTSAIMFV